MSATLELRLHKYLGGEAARLGAVAQIIALDDRGRRAPQRDRRDVVIPAGIAARPLSVDVEPGRYIIEALLPSGDAASAEVDAAAGQPTTVDLAVSHSPHEWLSWQQLMGNIPRTPDVPATGEWLESVLPLDPPNVLWIQRPVAALAGAGDGDAWQTIENAISRPDPLAGLAAEPATPAPVVVQDREWQLFRLGSAGPVGWVVDDPGGGDFVPRRYVVARSSSVVELACVPVPWERLQGGRVVIDTLVRNLRRPGEAVVAMSPLDPEVGTALGYMATGSLGAARTLFDTARDLLFGKTINPLAATAGGYVLLATEQAGDSSWHQWIENLYRWFPWLPDGAIQRGRLLLRHRRSKADVGEARAAFAEAYRRGLPYYSLGLQWLIDGLRQLASNDDELRAMLGRVQQVTWRANLQQPFTTLRLAGDESG